MDTSGCPPGWATDFWMTDHSAQPCGVPLAAFFVIFGALLLNKAYILFHTWRFWLKRFREMKKTKGAIAQRHPIVPSLITGIAIGYVLMMALIGSNTASVRNGGGGALYAVSASIWGSYTLFHVKKYLTLGRRLIPLAQVQFRVEDSSGAESSGSKEVITITSVAETSLSILSKLDMPLHLLRMLMFLSVALQLVFGLIPNLVNPAEPYWFRVVFGLVGMYSLFLYVSLVWHLERLVNATKICGRGMPGTTAGRKLARAIRIMRISQIVWFVFGNISFLAHLLAAVYVIDLTWIYMFGMLLIETAASTFAFLSTSARPKKNRLAVDATTTNREGRTVTSPGNGGSSFNSIRLNGPTTLITSHS